MNKASKYIGLLLLLLLQLSLIIPTIALAAPDPAAVGTSAQAATLIDVTSGRIISVKNGDKPMLIASLTKIMTAIVAIEQGKLSDKVKVSRNAFGKEGSSIFLKLGEEMSLENLLYGLMLRSGNDAATAIAEHVGGSVDGFVYLMNQKAEELGMKHSQFKNPHGLDAQGHFSTSNDLAKLTAYALHNPVFQEIVKTKVKRAPNSKEKWDYVWRNKNKMLTLFDGADGGKTGYTKQAGRCLISSATRNGQQLVVVTIDDPNDWLDHSNLLNYGFSNYPLREVVHKDDVISNTIYVAGRSFRYPLTEEETKALSKKIVWEQVETSNYQLGYRGNVNVYLDTRPIGTIPVFEKNSKLTNYNRINSVDSTLTNTIENRSFIVIWGAVLKAAITGQSS